MGSGLYCIESATLLSLLSFFLRSRYMAYNYAPRITRFFTDVSNALQEWCNLSQRFLVVQHNADEKVKQTHLHIAIWGSDIKEEALKRKFNSHMTEKLSGNEDWKWTSKKYPNFPAFDRDFIEPANNGEEQIRKYIKYCLKGDLSRVRMSKNISKELMEAARDDWIVKDDTKTPDVIVVEHKRVTQPPYQQLVIAEAAAKWYNYKNECKTNDTIIDKQQLKLFVCEAMRSVSRGINQYLVKDLAWAILFDDLDFRDYVLNKISI